MPSGAREFTIGIDVGTQGTKAVAVDLSDTRVIGRAAVGYDLIPDLGPGTAEQHPESWIDAVRDALGQLEAQGIDLGSVIGVGVSGQQHGLVLLDHEGAVVRPAKLWCDTSTTPEALELAERFGAPVPVGLTASKIAWVQRHEPDAWARTHSVMLPHDFINFRLTGQRSMETGDASGTGFFDVAARRFDEERVRLIGGELASRLPPLIEAPQTAGFVSESGAAWTGLRAGTPVAAGGGDNMMSAIGSGATDRGVVIISLGTSATAFAHSDTPVLDPQGLIAPFCGSAGGWLPLLCTMNATAIVEEVRAAFQQDHVSLTELASRIDPGSDGLVWLPFHIGERVPDLPNAVGILTGLRPGWLDPGRLYRAAIEAVTANLCWGIDRLGSLGIPVNEARLVGGGANNALWIQILADMLNTPVTPMQEPESAALGAAIQAAWTVDSDQSKDRISEIAASLNTRGATVQPSASVSAYARYRDAFAEQLRYQHDTH